MKRFFKFLLQNTLIAIVSTSFAFLILLVLLVGIVASFAPKQPTFPREAILTVDLSMNLTDTPPAKSLQEMMMEVISDEAPPQYHVRDMIQTIERASNDRRIKGILLHGSFTPMYYGCSYPALQEFREALMAFKDSGKPIIAYSVSPSTRDLYVMSIADEFYLNQSGAIMLPGLYSEPMYFKNALEKFGIGVQAVRVGDFKSAIEPYTRTGMSDEAREASELLLTDLWDEILSDIVEARQLDEAATRRLLDDKPIIFAEAAADSGLVDDIKSHIEVRERLIEISGEDEDTHSYRQIGLRAYVMEHDQFKRHPSGEGIAVVYAEGAIVGGEGENYQAGAERIVFDLREARQNPNTKGIVLRVNSPGGSATASRIIEDELQQIKAQGLPLIVSMGGYAASGGYLISESADYIFSHPHTVTGSIGIFGMLMHVGEGAGKLGITFDEVKTTRNSDIMSIAKPKTEEQLALIQDFMSSFYNEWTERVAENRDQSVEHIRSIASGRVWSGNQALENGLVDELGGITEAIAYAATAADIGEDYVVYEYPKKLTEDEAIAAALGMQNAKLKTLISGHSAPSAKTQIQNWMAELEDALSLFNDPVGAYTYSPLIYK